MGFQLTQNNKKPLHFRGGKAGSRLVKYQNLRVGICHASGNLRQLPVGNGNILYRIAGVCRYLKPFNPRKGFYLQFFFIYYSLNAVFFIGHEYIFRYAHLAEEIELLRYVCYFIKIFPVFFIKEISFFPFNKNFAFVNRGYTC